MKQAVEKKGIKNVLHFTRWENLSSILREGLIPRQSLETWASRFVFNDQVRVDYQKNANCLSIGHPNYKMFYGLRCADPSTQWVVITFKENVLWEKNCAFCVENAASSKVSSIPIEERKGIGAFEAMFAPSAGARARVQLGIPNHFPTNPQAEVLGSVDV